MGDADLVWPPLRRESCKVSRSSSGWDGTVKEKKVGRQLRKVREIVEVFCDICDQLYVNKCVVRVSVLSTFPSCVRKFISGQPKLVPTLRKFFPSDQTVKNARNSNVLSSNCGVPNLWTKAMATKGTSFVALVYTTSSLFEGRLHSRILQFIRTLVLFFVFLVGFEEWFCVFVGSLPEIRRVISCILFSLEQSRVVDLRIAEHHPDSILKSNDQNFEFSLSLCCDV